jgi:hypothetical protein
VLSQKLGLRVQLKLKHARWREKAKKRRGAHRAEFYRSPYVELFKESLNVAARSLRKCFSKATQRHVQISAHEKTFADLIGVAQGN